MNVVRLHSYRVIWSCLLLCLSGCEHLGFYQQAALGQLALISQAVPFTEVIDDPATSPELRGQLQMVANLLEFSANEIGLDADRRYQRYVSLPREHVVWNVFVAAPTDLSGHYWCYPIVGCAPYRGYFRQELAQRQADRYRSRGFDTYVAGVDAYSTLGWFDDPILSSFIDYPPVALANLLIHELSHSKVWVAGDVAFNEGFANFIGQAGAQQWLSDSAEGAKVAPVELERWRANRAHWRRFRAYALAVRDQLAEIYAQEHVSKEDKVLQRQALHARAIQCYQVLRKDLGNGRFDRLMETSFNNAFFVSLATYEDWQPAFAAIFLAAGKSWPDFFRRVTELADSSKQIRLQQLEQLRAQGLAQQQKAQGADDNHADQIQCKALAHHVLN